MTAKPATDSYSDSKSGSDRDRPDLITPPSRMRAVVARRYGTADVVAIEDVPVPAPDTGEVLVGVAASSLNALDWHFLTGTPYFLRLMSGLRRPRRVIPGADVAGTVVAVGPGVERVAVGDKVFGEASGRGGCSPYATVAERSLAALPVGVSFEAAAATPVAGLTALQGLRTHGKVQPGDRVLVNGAAGGVGTFAVQIAKALGAEVTAVCSTRNVAMVRDLGADGVIDYTRDEVTAAGANFDVLLDNVGTLRPAECRRLLTPHGRYVMVGGSKANPWVDPIPSIIRGHLSFLRASQSFHQFVAASNREDLDVLGQLLADGQVKPAIQRVIGLDGVAAALAEIGTGHVRAKIVVVPAER